jgi:hypothetical protein
MKSASWKFGILLVLVPIAGCAAEGIDGDATENASSLQPPFTKETVDGVREVPRIVAGPHTYIRAKRAWFEATPQSGGFCYAARSKSARFTTLRIDAQSNLRPDHFYEVDPVRVALAAEGNLSANVITRGFYLRKHDCYVADWSVESVRNVNGAVNESALEAGEHFARPNVDRSTGCFVSKFRRQDGAALINGDPDFRVDSNSRLVVQDKLERVAVSEFLGAPTTRTIDRTMVFSKDYECYLSQENLR